MGLFSRGPSVNESLAYAIQAFGTGVLNLDDSERSRISKVALGAVTKFVQNQSMSEEEKQSSITMYGIISGSVGINPSPLLDTYDKAQEVAEIIESTLPFNMPLVVLGPIRMVIEEYISGKPMKEIDYEYFDRNGARQLVNALMKAVEIVNTRCVQEPKKHPKNEVMCLAYLASVVSIYAKEQLY